MHKPYHSILCFILVLCLFIFTACNGTAVPDNRQNSLITLTLWHYYTGENQAALVEAIDKFNQTIGIEEGIIVEAVGMGSISNLEEQVEASAKGVINSEPMPDIFSSYPDVAYKIDMLGKLADLNSYFIEDEKARYIADFLADGIFSEDRLLVMPIVKSTELLYINATTWEEFAQENGYDAADLETWEALYETAKEYYAWSKGTALIGFDSVANYIITACRQMGTEVISSDDNGGHAVLDETALRRLFTVYYQGISMGYFGDFGAFRSDDLKQGELISYIGSSSGASYFPTEVTIGNIQTPIEFLALPYPTFEGGTPFAIQQGAGMCVSTSDPEREAAAALFLKWFTEPEQNIAFALTTGYLPVTHEAYVSSEFSSSLENLANGSKNERIINEVYQAALEQITELNTYSAPVFEESHDLRNILQASLLTAGEEGLTSATQLRERQLSEDEILVQLNTEEAFQRWLQDIKLQLEQQGITYIEQ